VTQNNAFQPPSGKARRRRPWTAEGMGCPVLAVDAVIRMGEGVVLVRRGRPPFEGWWALPGGLCQRGETVEEAMCREVEEETGLLVEPVRLIGVFSDPDRDPRGHTVSVAFLARPVGGKLRAASDAAGVKVFRKLPERLAFDHRRILVASGLRIEGMDRHEDG